MFKKANVVMLPTNDEAVLNTHQSNLAKHLGKENYLTYNEICLGNIPHTGYNLYITSDEVIKEGDWFLTDDRDRRDQNDGKPIYKLFQCTSIFNSWIGINNNKDIGFNPDWSFKIIASTNPKLIIRDTIGISALDVILPQVSSSFINKYIKEYNKGNIITEVMVKYNEYDDPCDFAGIPNAKITQLEINSKDNTITIKKINDIWIREEVENLLFSLAENYAMTSTKSEIEDFNNWIKQNL